VVLWMIYGREQSTVPTARAASATASTVVAPASTGTPAGTEVGGRFGRPAFCAVVLEEPTLVYLVDRSGLTPPALTAVKQSLSKSLDSLRSDQRFQIIFWNSEGEQNVVAIPAAGPRKATADVSAAAMAELLEPEGTAKATISESEDAPTSAAIAQPDHSATALSTKEDFSGNGGPPGQTFALKAALTLKAITVKGVASSSQSGGQGSVGRVTLTISQVEKGGVLKRLRQESATGGFTSGGAYQTFTLAKPVALAAGKVYAYDIFTEHGSYGFAKSSSDVYLAGVAMQHGDAARTAADGAKLSRAQRADRTFFINPVIRAKPALERAFAQHPAVMVLVTARAYDEGYATRVLAMRSADGVKVHVVRIADARSDAKALRRIAGTSGGEYRQLAPVAK
jgi:hypothetical protein